MDSIKTASKYFFLELLDGSSTRVQLVWLTFFAWICGIIWFGMMVPIVRETSIIFYRQSHILQDGKIAPAINLTSEYAGTILTMLSSAFLGTVISYVSSNWTMYKTQSNPPNKTDLNPKQEPSTQPDDKNKLDDNEK